MLMAVALDTTPTGSSWAGTWTDHSVMGGPAPTLYSTLSLGSNARPTWLPEAQGAVLDW